MSKTTHLLNETGLYFVTTDTGNDTPFFKDPRKCLILQQTVLFQRRKGRINLYAFVVMPNHLHIILATANNFPLSRTIQSIKGFSAYTINRQNGTTHQIWQKGYYEHGIRNEQDFMEKYNYIANNPARKGLSDRIDNYPWSSFYKDKTFEIDKIVF